MKNKKIGLYNLLWVALVVVTFASAFAVIFYNFNVYAFLMIVWGFFCILLLAYGGFKRDNRILTLSLVLLLFSFLGFLIGINIRDRSFPGIGLLMIYLYISGLGIIIIILYLKGRIDFT